MNKRILIAALASVLAAPTAFADPPPWAPAHGHRAKHHHHDDDDDDDRGPRVIYVQPAPPPPPQTVVVYPPWIVQQQGQYVYQQQYQPAPPTVAVNRCNSQTVGRVLGGVVGGVLGHQIGEGNGKRLATVGGAVAGVLVGGEIGRSIDAGNQGCVGQVLEVAPVGQRVQWVDSGVTYRVVPQAVVMRHGGHCRPYTMEVQTHHGWRRTQGMACRRPGGVWVAA